MSVPLVINKIFNTKLLIISEISIGYIWAISGDNIQLVWFLNRNPAIIQQVWVEQLFIKNNQILLILFWKNYQKTI